MCHEDNWAPEYGGPKLAAEPNPGQLNPTNPHVYSVLENIYRDLLEAFSMSGEQPVSMFHMGGDEVNFHCWAKSKAIREWMLDRGYSEDPVDDNKGYLELWGTFQVGCAKSLLLNSWKE